MIINDEEAIEEYDIEFEPRREIKKRESNNYLFNNLTFLSESVKSGTLSKSDEAIIGSIYS